MSRRRTLVAGLLVLGCWTASGSALAQAPAQAPTAVEGGSSFGTATSVGPGTYTDTIQQREELYFAVALADGQRLDATAVARGRPDSPADDGTVLRLNISNPTRDGQVEGRQEFFTGRADARVTVQSAVVGDLSTLGGPGRWFVRVELYDTGAGNLLAGVDYAYELTVSVTQVRPPTTTTTVDLAPRVEASLPEEVATGRTESARRTPVGTALAGSAASLLVGAALGGGAARVRRRHRSPPR